MLEFVAAPENRPFTTALLVMLGIALAEGGGTLLWGGFSQVIDSLLPEMDTDVDIDADVDADAAGPQALPLSAEAGLLLPILAWLRVGKVPILVLLVIFLTGFGLTGLLLQAAVQTLAGRSAPAMLLVLPALALALPGVRTAGGAIARALPKEETSAVSSATFVGRIATIVLGTTRRGIPAQARLRDQHGRSHYVMVEPDLDGDEFSQGEDVLLVRQSGARFRVIRPPSAALLADPSGSR